jgi:subtilisin-like proprotein convertase family protein
VTLNISHTYDSDLVIQLVSPSGRVETLANRLGGGGDNYTNTVFDSTASTSITAGRAPFAGTYRPQSSLGVFDNLDARGTWTLRVSDVAYLDQGTLNSWTLSITGSAGIGSPAVNVASGPTAGSAAVIGLDTVPTNAGTPVALFVPETSHSVNVETPAAAVAAPANVVPTVHLPAVTAGTTATPPSVYVPVAPPSDPFEADAFHGAFVG